MIKKYIDLSATIVEINSEPDYALLMQILYFIEETNF